MNQRERRQLGRYIRHIADEMGLRDWAIRLGTEHAENGDAANCLATYGQRRATIWVAHNFREQHPEDQRDTIIHELVHLHLEPSVSMVLKDLDDLLGKQADMLFCRAFERQFEYGVDGLAGAIARHMPLIEWPS